MERKSSKEYSVVFLVEGEKFKLLNLPSRTSSLLSVLVRTLPITKPLKTFQGVAETMKMRELL